MADVKVRAKRLGQLPNGDWVNEGDEFQIEEAKVSKRWMVVLSKPKAAKAKATVEGGED